MDVMEIEIMEDGVLKVKTTDISEANHINADELLAEIESTMGGSRTTEKVEHEFWKTRSVQRIKGRTKIVRAR